MYVFFLLKKLSCCTEFIEFYQNQYKILGSFMSSLGPKLVNIHSTYYTISVLPGINLYLWHPKLLWLLFSSSPASQVYRSMHYHKKIYFALRFRNGSRREIKFSDVFKIKREINFPSTLKYKRSMQHSCHRSSPTRSSCLSHWP